MGALGFYDVRDYGAVGNGIANDTTSIQQAINAAAASTDQGGTVFFERGSYLISSTLTVPARVRLLGVLGFLQDFSTSLNFVGSGTAIQFTGDYSGIEGVGIVTTTGATGVDTNGGTSLTFREMNIRGFSLRGVRCAGSFRVLFHRVHIQNAPSGGNGIVATERFNQNVIDNCAFTCVSGQSWTAIDIGTVGAMSSSGSCILNSIFQAADR